MVTKGAQRRENCIVFVVPHLVLLVTLYLLTHC